MEYECYEHWDMNDNEQHLVCKKFKYSKHTQFHKLFASFDYD